MLKISPLTSPLVNAHKLVDAEINESIANYGTMTSGSPVSKPMKVENSSKSPCTKKKTHAELRVRELFTAGVAGAESVIPLPHRGANTAYSQVITFDMSDEEVADTVNMKRIDDYDNNDDSNPSDSEDDIPDRSLCHLFGINSFSFAYGLVIATFGLITLPTEAENLWPEKHAMLLAMFLVICGVSQLSGPIAGFFSDRCTSPYGRRRPFLLFSGLLGIPSLYVLRYASMSHNVYLYVGTFFIAMLSVNVMYVAYSGALTDLVNEKQRGIANGLMGAFAVTGASFGFGCFSYFLDVENGYIFYMIILSASVIISMVAYTEIPILDAAPWTWKDIAESYWVDPIEHRDFFLVFVSRTFYYMGVSVQTFMLFYFRDVVSSGDPQADVAYLALLGQLSGAIFCVPMGLLSNRTGRKPLIYLSSAILVCTYCVFMVSRSRMLALIGGAIYGIGNGTYLSVDYALACDTIPSKDNAARYLGIWGVGAFIGTLLGPLLVGPALLIFGDKGQVDENGTPMYDVQGYVAILIIGCLCFIAGAVTVAPVRSAR